MNILCIYKNTINPLKYWADHWLTAKAWSLYPTKILNLSLYIFPDTFNICLMVPHLIFISSPQ